MPVVFNKVRPVQLEVLSRIPEQPVGEAPLLFIHGSFVGAWCWEEHFLPFFADHGYAAYALSLRGHGNSEGKGRLHWTALREYVADVEQVVTELGRKPILIGHSMGGIVVQKYLEQNSMPGIVLMASVPPHGLWPEAVRLAFENPLLLQTINLIQFGGPVFATLDLTKRAIFSADAPDWLVAQYHRRMQEESRRAVIDMNWLDLPNSIRQQRLAALVLGAENDALVGQGAVRATARVFGVQAQMMPGIAHAMMLETGWRTVAERILAWLRRL